LDAILKLSSMGDIIHSLIVLPKLTYKVNFIVDNSFKEILEYHPLIENIIPIHLREIKKNKLLIFKELTRIKKLHYQNIYDLQGLLKSAIVGKMMSNNLIGYQNPREKIASFFYNKKIKSTKKYAIERYLELFEIEDKEYLVNHPKLLFYREKRFEFLSPTKKNIVFIIGATWPCKKVSKEIWLTLANEIPENIIIPYYNEEEKDEAFWIAKNSKNVLPISLNLNDLKALIDKVDLLIGNDTGPSFIAWANNIKNIVLYGCTYNNKILENKFSKAVEVQNRKIDKNLDVIHLLKTEKILKVVDELLY